MATQEAFDHMHKTLPLINLTKRHQSRVSKSKKKGVILANFVVGDFVLYRDVWLHHRGKLRTTWCGPAVVTQVLSHWIYEIQNLITSDHREVHACHLKFYADSELAVSADFLSHIAHNGEGFEVSDILDARYVGALCSLSETLRSTYCVAGIPGL